MLEHPKGNLNATSWQSSLSLYVCQSVCLCLSLPLYVCVYVFGVPLSYIYVCAGIHVYGC